MQLVHLFVSIRQLIVTTDNGRRLGHDVTKFLMNLIRVIAVFVTGQQVVMPFLVFRDRLLISSGALFGCRCIHGIQACLDTRCDKQT